MKRVKWLIILLLIIVLLVIFIPSSFSQAISGPASDHAGGPRDRLEVVLQADSAPGPGGTASLTFDVTPLIAAPDLEIHWVVPEGVELLGDDAEVIEAVISHQTVTSQRQIRFPSKGTYKVAVGASFAPAQDVQFAASGVLFFTISEHGSRVSDKDPDARSPMGSKLEPSGFSSPVPENTITSSNDDPCFTVFGKILRTDRVPNTGGFDPPVTIPVPNALIEISEEDILFDDTYADVITDQNGRFSYSFCDDDGWFDDELEIYIQLESELYSGGHFVAEVQDISYIDEVYEFDSWVVDSEGGAIQFDVMLNEEQSAIFNMAQAAFDAWKFWNASGGEAGGDSIFDEEAEIHWEAGYGEDGSYYNSGWEEITIADDPSDPDQWDESVIMHEWTHMADDYYSCDDSPGGDHKFSQLLNPQLAWGEGYPDYYQSVARDGTGYPLGNFYIDVKDVGATDRNLETFDKDYPDLVSPRNELAIAAALWDLQDVPADDQDTVTYGHAAIQYVFTHTKFEWHPSDCDFDIFMQTWVDLNKPADKETAAAIHQNTGYTLIPSSVSIQAQNNTQFIQTDPDPSEYIWWNQLTYLVDNSKSMAGNKFDAVKTVLAEAINDLGGEPEGTEFMLTTFNNTSPAIQEVFAGQFFPERLTSAVNSLTTSGATDSICRVNGLNSLTQAIIGQSGGDAWLFTDGDDNQSFITAEIMSQLLNDRDIRASIALLGLCPAVQITLSESELQNQRYLEGAAEALLGAAADGTPGGVVPYLLTAINSGGQFLFVDASQAENAADILRAQITHSAGAGKWSDYVSDHTTYRYDKLTSWEYNWIDAATGGTNWGTPLSTGYKTVDLPGPFSYYNTRGVNKANVYENGYLTLGNYYGVQHINTSLPNSEAPNNALYPFWDDLAWQLLCAQGVDSPAGCGLTGYIYSKQEGDWFAIEWKDFYATLGEYNTFEVLLNRNTAEIRYQYDTIPDGAGGATIGLENATGSHGVQVSYNDVSGASDDMGYKFTPAPPQPTKTYTVTVDSLMSGVGFLLTGYSGSFENLAVYYPNDTLVDCNDTANVLCLDLGLVQYIQADVDNKVGVWKAVVDAGPTGEGTFSFTSFASGELSPSIVGDHKFSTAGSANIIVDLGVTVAGQQLTGWFQQPDGSAFGGQFPMFDDGNHNDGLKEDGVFGSGPFTPTSAGTGYLWLKGVSNGVNFIRSAPTPFTFQPVDITSHGDGANFGEETTLQFTITNHDAYTHWFKIDYHLPQGWYLTGMPSHAMVLLDPSESYLLTVDVYMGPVTPNDLPSGTTGQVAISVTEFEEGEIHDSASAAVTRHRPPAEIRIFNPASSLRPDGDSATLDFLVLDDQGVVVADGTEVQLSASLGTISPTLATTNDGAFMATFTSGSSTGTATITALTGNNVTADTTIDISLSIPYQVELTSSKDHLLPDGISTAALTATISDQWGAPVSNQMVRIGVSGDGQLATIGSSEVISGTTDSNGQIQATLTSGTEEGVAYVRAELLVPVSQGYEASIDDYTIIYIHIPRLFLPIIGR